LYPLDDGKLSPVGTAFSRRTTLTGSATNTLEHDRFKWEQESSRFFEKKRRKKRLFGWAYDGETSTAQFKKVFLLLFVHKKKPSSSLRHDLSQTDQALARPGPFRGVRARILDSVFGKVAKPLIEMASRRGFEPLSPP
jgi:hypothetical protein